MKKMNFAIKLFSLFALMGLLLTISCSKGDEVIMDDGLSAQQEPSLAGYTSEPIEGQYIVTFKAGFETKSAALKDLDYNEKTSLIRSEISNTFSKSGISDANIKAVYGFTVNGFAAKLNKDQLSALKNDLRISRIEQDYMITLSPITAYKRPAPEPVGEEVPWGIARVGGGAYTGSSTAWIIDSGIDLDHPDLNVDVTRSACFLDRGDADDENGHGTHVAGTVAALDNEIGVIGVAPGATLVSVRVLDRRGSGSISGVIAGVDYVGANGAPGDVANMSLGGSVSTTLDEAVFNASTNVKFALAAGNESDDANNHSPARVNGPNIYTVSAMDSSDNWAYFSNYGNPPIDFCAPGVSIYSTWKDGGYNTISGTSMASPHVCGLLLLGTVGADGTVNGDPDGNPDPIAHH